MLKKKVVAIINKFGYSIEKTRNVELEEFETDKQFQTLYNLCKENTMTSKERMFALYQATNYIINNNLHGSFVECGVWKGGSSMMMAKTLLERNVSNRSLFLYDTYEGMSEPTEKDIAITGDKVVDRWETVKSEDKIFCYSSFDEVSKNLASTRYPQNLINMVKGKVEDTIPNVIPEQIALLRLDTDWFESTYHELKFLYPRLVKGGVLIIDDYGHWQGAKMAVDQFFKEINVSPLLNRIDYTGRIMVKQE